MTYLDGCKCRNADIFKNVLEGMQADEWEHFRGWLHAWETGESSGMDMPGAAWHKTQTWSWVKKFNDIRLDIIKRDLQLIIVTIYTCASPAMTNHNQSCNNRKPMEKRQFDCQVISGRWTAGFDRLLLWSMTKHESKSLQFELPP